MADEKEARFARVATAVVAIVVRAGPEQLNYAAVARRARVSRPWIYKYFGRDKHSLVEFAAAQIGGAFAELDGSVAGESVDGWRENVRAATRRGFADTVANPWVVELYFRYRHSANRLGEAVRDVEKRHARRFSGDVPRALSGDERRVERFVGVFTAARLGLYHRWLDPEFRREHAVDEVVGRLDAVVDAFCRECGRVA